MSRPHCHCPGPCWKALRRLVGHDRKPCRMLRMLYVVTSAYVKKYTKRGLVQERTWHHLRVKMFMPDARRRYCSLPGRSCDKSNSSPSPSSRHLQPARIAGLLEHTLGYKRPSKPAAIGWNGLLGLPDKTKPPFPHSARSHATAQGLRLRALQHQGRPVGFLSA